MLSVYNGLILKMVVQNIIIEKMGRNPSGSETVF